jgi:cytochrome c
MTFAGLAKPEDRANVLAYLNSQGSNIPLPPPPVATTGPTEATPTAIGEPVVENKSE